MSTQPDKPTNEEQLRAFVESLDMDGFKRAPKANSVRHFFRHLSGSDLAVSSDNQ